MAGVAADTFSSTSAFFSAPEISASSTDRTRLKTRTAVPIAEPAGRIWAAPSAAVPTFVTTLRHGTFFKNPNGFATRTPLDRQTSTDVADLRPNSVQPRRERGERIDDDAA